MSVAFFVASFSVIGIEINAKMRAKRELEDTIAGFVQYREAVSRDVFQAVLENIVPTQMVNEIKELLREKFIKVDCEYTMRFLPKSGEMMEGSYILRRDLAFKVINLSGQPGEFPVYSKYASDEDLKGIGWGNRPFHLELSVNNVQVEPRDFQKDGLATIMTHSIKLGPGESASVFISGEEPMRIEASRSFYQQSSPVDGLEVVIENELRDKIGDIEVQMHHPGRAQMQPVRPNRYILRRAFFPGQGFEVSWKRIGAGAEKGQASPTPAQVVKGSHQSILPIHR